MAPAAITVVTQKAFGAELIYSKTSAFPQRNDENSRIPTFVLAVLMEVNVIPLILICLQ